jgi:hypothetical protein
VRDCPRSEELRAALAAEEPPPPELAGHVAACATCARIAASANRFESLLEATMGDLVTDALPPSTAAIARSAPRAARSRAVPRIVASAIVTVALVAFAVVGVMTTGTAITDALQQGSAPAVPERSMSVECILGDPAVEVVADGTGAGAAEVRITYCLDLVPTVASGRELAMTCLRSGSAARIEGEGYLDACTRVEAVGVTATDPRAKTDVAPSAPFATWDVAVDAAAWPVRRPGWVPSGFALVALQGFGPSTDPDAIDSLVATYIRSATPLSIDQFAVADPSEFRIELTLFGNDLDSVTTGRTTVGGQAAFWATGVRTQSVLGPQADVDTIVLTWSDGSVGYRITARGLELEDLRRIGDSLDEG